MTKTNIRLAVGDSTKGATLEGKLEIVRDETSQARPIVRLPLASNRVGIFEWNKVSASVETYVLTRIE